MGNKPRFLFRLANVSGLLGLALIVIVLVGPWYQAVSAEAGGNFSFFVRIGIWIGALLLVLSAILFVMAMTVGGDQKNE